MTLNDDLAIWLALRPDWQKDAVARFCRGEIYASEDIAATAEQLIDATYPSASDVSVADLPGSTATGEPVTLVQLTEVVGVNALVEGQSLTFEPGGLTIIFGNNASGKSGYARLIREAVTARVKAGRLLGDVFADDVTTQAAKIDFLIGSDATTWKLGDAQSQDLSRIRFYDEICGAAYVTKASEVNYRPSALTILDQLSDVCEAVAGELNQRLAANLSARPQLPTLHSGTLSEAFLAGLTADTSSDAIAAATTLLDGHDAELAKKLAEETRLKTSDPSKEKARLEALSRDWLTIERHAKALVDAFGSDPLRALEAQRRHATELHEAARIASAGTFDSEPLSSVGSDTWRALWEAAREFSSTDAYHDHEYPFTGEGSVCVLCQQPLAEQAVDRLARFHAFVSDTTSRDADTAAAALAVRRDHLVQLQSLPLAVSTAANRLQDDGEDVTDALDWLDSATQAVVSAIAWMDGADRSNLRPVEDTLSARIAARAQELSSLAASIDASTFTQALASLSEQVVELRDAKALSEARAVVEAEVARLAQRREIENVRRLTATNAITTKRGELTEMYVTQEVRDRFTRETERLELRRVTLNRTGRGRDAALEHQPSLVGTRRAAEIPDVLSEGEQTALGLAGFLTEVELDASMSGVVFDDPVCSLDAGRRSRVAERLVELASRRQVIVFTHEITFVHALKQQAKSQSVHVAERAVQCLGAQPGVVSDQLPWQAKDVLQRVSELESELARLKSERSDLTDDQYAERMGSLAGRLSETLERAIHIHIVNELVDRGTNEVRPTMLKILPKFTQEDHDEFQAAYAKTSSWAARHDNAPEENYVPPTIDDVEKELVWLRGWHGRLKRYRN